MKDCKSKRLLALMLLLASVFLFATGCTININIGNLSNDTTNTTTPNHNSDATSSVIEYQSKASIIVKTHDTEKNTLSSSDLAVSQELIDTYSVILQSDTIQGKIRKEYPDVDFALTLESQNQTAILAVKATSNHPECLEEICNMAVSLLCEEIPQLIVGSSCTVVNRAEPAQLVGAN